MATRGSVRSQIGPNEPRDSHARERSEPPPETVGEALARARQHGRAAAAEALAMVRALIDAASLAASGRPVGGEPAPRPAGQAPRSPRRRARTRRGRRVLADPGFDRRGHRRRDRPVGGTGPRRHRGAYRPARLPRAAGDPLGVRRSAQRRRRGRRFGRAPAPAAPRVVGRRRSPGGRRIQRVPVQG